LQEKVFGKLLESFYPRGTKAQTFVPKCLLGIHPPNIFLYLYKLPSPTGFTSCKCIIPQEWENQDGNRLKITLRKWKNVSLSFPFCVDKN
jgi:hypothetical protein